MRVGWGRVVGVLRCRLEEKKKRGGGPQGSFLPESRRKYRKCQACISILFFGFRDAEIRCRYYILSHMRYSPRTYFPSHSKPVHSE